MDTRSMRRNYGQWPEEFIGSTYITTLDVNLKGYCIDGDSFLSSYGKAVWGCH